MHGGDIYSEKIKYDFSISVNPLGFPSWAKGALKNSIKKISSYPDASCRTLIHRLSAFTGLAPENLLLGNGASELISAIIRALGVQNALLFSPCFTGYKAALEGAGAGIFYLPKALGLPLQEDSLPDQDWLKKNEIDLVIVTNPNNPDGTPAGKAALEKLSVICRNAGAFLLIDQCFMALSDNPENHFEIPPENTIILRAFTKTFAMPGLRLGWAYADAGLCIKIKNQLPEWNVSLPAQEAGSAILSDKKKLERYLEKARRLIKKERDYLSSGLKRLGFRVFESAGNFILFKAAQGALAGEGDLSSGKSSLYHQLKAKYKILIRQCGDFEGLSTEYYRVCIKNHRENRHLLHSIKKNLENQDKSGGKNGRN